MLVLWQRAPVLLGISLFIAFAVLARFYDTFPGDAWALRELVQLRSDWLDGAAIFVSSIGQGGVGWGIQK